nr:NUDIX hydrolase [Amylibacter sp.]
MRRFGEPRKKGVLYRQRPGAYGVILQGQDLLLTLQNAEVPELQLPGGGMDPGETPTRALHREVFEETGYHITGLRRIGAYQRYTYMPEYSLWARKICHIYLCHPTLRIGDPTEPEHTAIWMPAVDAIQHLSNSGDRHFTEQLLRALL